MYQFALLIGGTLAILAVALLIIGQSRAIRVNPPNLTTRNPAFNYHTDTTGSLSQTTPLSPKIAASCVLLSSVVLSGPEAATILT